MPEKERRKIGLLQKLADRIVFLLTGERPRRRNSGSSPISLPSKMEVHPKPVISGKSKGHHKRNKSWLARLQSNLINPEGEKRRRIHHQKRAFPKIAQVKVPANDASTDIETPHVNTKTRVYRHQGRKKQTIVNQISSFFRRYSRKSRRVQRPKLVLSTIKDDFRKALPGEGYAFLNSLGFYILAYLVVYIVYQFTGAVVASNFGIDSVLFYYEIYFPIGNASPLWSRFNIIAITLASPFASVVISLILFRGILIREAMNPQLRLFLLWVAFHGATYFLGAFVAGIVTSQGFGYVANWLFLNSFFRILISLIFLFLLTVTGYYSAVFALETIPPGIRQKRWRQSLALGSRFILPWIIGGLIVIVAKYPDTIPQHPNIMVYDAVVIATMGFMVIPAFFNYKAKPRSLVERPRRHKRPPGILISIIAIITLILFRLAFERGIHLIMNFSFDVGFYR